MEKWFRFLPHCYVIRTSVMTRKPTSQWSHQGVAIRKWWQQS